jgi:hypothetical protein
MVQDPEGEHRDAEGLVNTSPELDMVTLYRSSTVDAGIEADIIRGLLDSHGIPSMIRRAMGYPSLGFEVQVHQENLRDAERLIEEARAAGPGAALEAERAGEEDR